MLNRTPLIVLLVTILCWSPAMSQEVVKPPKVETVLKTLDPSHPRLMLTDAGLAELKGLIAKDAVLAKCVDAMLKRADDICRKPVLLYNKRGPRLLHVSRECLKRTTTLGLAFRLTGKQKYADAAKRNLLAVCDFDDWNPSHFLDTAEMSHAVGIGYDWFFHVFDAATREKLRAGLIRNGLKPGLAAYRSNGRGQGWWIRAIHNWNQVCNGGLIVGALAIAETDPELAAEIVTSAVRLLPNAMVHYGPDGGWGEGPGYWDYATRYTAFALESLESSLGTDFGLSKIDGFSETGWFPICLTGPTGVYFNYPDCGSTESPHGNIPCLFWLARRFDNAAFAAVERDFARKRPGDPWDVLWYVPKGKSPARPKLDKHFRGPVEVAVFRSAWDDPDALFFAVKAGFNRVNHAHLDLGSFVIDALGVRWASDLGADDYNLPGYWEGRTDSGKRWSYYRLGSLSHNVPLINNRHQAVRARTKFQTFRSTPARVTATVELTSAYPVAKKVVRGAALLGRRRVLIQDEFDFKGPREVAWGMTTAAKITLDGNRATLTRDGKQLRAEILSPAGAVFAKESAEQKPPEKTNRGYRRLMIRLPGVDGHVTVAVLLSPVWPDGKDEPPPRLKPLAEW